MERRRFKVIQKASRLELMSLDDKQYETILSQPMPGYQMVEYLAVGTVDTRDVQKPSVVSMHIIPHHTVYKETISATKVRKVRVVFDGSLIFVFHLSSSQQISAKHSVRSSFTKTTVDIGAYWGNIPMMKTFRFIS
ncbi:hypothetical protein PR048_018021 [Dryococelus australis]|uniref:Uncharacterized protein n=1 Tax=Dryococelus australis TaxID=614101 RepID=A0ABQ9HB94_9NEOP|nr:hypothetical protein PR048_018021 [Dryococelus australis]